MAEIIGVRFQSAGKIYFFDAEGLEVAPGNHVIVETSRGIEFGEVDMGKHFRPDESLLMPLKKVIRIATEQDIVHANDLRQHEKDAYSICQKKIAEHKLEMKLVSVEAAFDNSKLLFYFTANGRVDFRSLVKDLASVFKTRIELRQIGVRDEAKMLGGLGPCGRPICCGTFLGDFEPVSIKMAKEQNLSLNPTKISGVCGRLMCCLKYEEDDYEQTRKRMPKVGKEVITPDGKGYVTDLNIVKEMVKVRISKGDEFEINEYRLEDIQRIGFISNEKTENSDMENISENETDISERQDTEISPADDKENNSSEVSDHTDDESEVEQKSEENQNTRADKRNKPWKKREGNRPDIHERNYGKPVRRENKDRAREQMAENGKDQPLKDKTILTQQPVKTIQATPVSTTAPTKPINNWQAALEKAIRAAEEK